MISYLKGSIEYIGENYIIVETMGVGYSVFVSSQTISTLPQLHSEIKIFTYMSVKDDGISLFGFKKMEDLELFNKLITVSGIGPKGALNILGVMSASVLIMAIVSEDAKAISKAPGIGAKTAQRLIIELKDKFKTEDFIESVTEDFAVADTSCSAEAIEALLALGYSRSEAVGAVSKVYEKTMTTQEILKNALKKMIK